MEAPPLPLDPAALPRRRRPLHPHRPTAVAEAAAETAVNVRGGHRIEAETGRKEKRGVIVREEGVAEVEGTPRDQKRGGRGGARREGAGRLGAIGSIKIETGRTRGADVGFIQPQC